MRRLLIGLLLLFVSMCILVRSYTLGGLQSRHAVPVDAATPGASAAMRRTVQAVGYVEPVTEVRRLSFKTDGVIAHCNAEVGRSFKRGEVIVELDGREQVTAVAVAEADLALAIADQEKMESGVNPHQIAAAEHKVELLKEQARYQAEEHRRYTALLTRSSVSTSEHDKVMTEHSQRQVELKQAEAELDHLRHFVRPEDRSVARAQVEAARARLGLARERREDAFLRAPFDGTVLEVLRREGEAARSSDSDAVLVYGDVSRLRIRAEVDERFVSALRLGQKATIVGRGLGTRTYEGRLVVVKPIMGKKTVFSRTGGERRDLDVIQVLVEMPDGFVAPVGLEVDVAIECPPA